MVEEAMPSEPQRSVTERGAAEETIRISAAALKTPVGMLYVAATAARLVSIELPRYHASRSFERWMRERLFSHSSTPALRKALAQLREYFAGKRRDFDVPLDPCGTDFQQRVWRAVAAIPYGETVSYGEIAVDLGTPHLARAVGAAVGANPIPIVIPCHRVLGADGSLTGYGGGLRMKAWLLQHEGVLLA
jgi:methylated-DNA-[protein]-cysteine S-methyltransferase